MKKIPVDFQMLLRPAAAAAVVVISSAATVNFSRL